MEKAVSRRVTGRRPQLVKNAQSWRQQAQIEVDRFSPAAGAPEPPSACKGDLARRERTAPCARRAAAFYRKGPPFRQSHSGDSGEWEGASRLMRRLLRYSRMQMTSCKQTITYQAMEE